MVDKTEKSDATYRCYLFTLRNFCVLQACVPLLVVLHCGVACVSYVLVYNYECAERTVLTLKRTLLKWSFWGRSGPRISNIAVGSSYCFYFFVYARLKRENSPRKTYFMQTFTNYHQCRVQALSIPTIYSLWGVLLTSMQRLRSKRSLYA